MVYNTKIYFLMVLKTTRCLCVLNALGRITPWLFPASGPHWQALIQWPYFSVSLYCHAISPVAVLSLCPHFPFIRHQWLDLGPTLIECDFILMRFVKTLFLDKVSLTGVEWTWILSRTLFKSVQLCRKRLINLLTISYKENEKTKKISVIYLKGTFIWM